MLFVWTNLIGRFKSIVPIKFHYISQISKSLRYSCFDESHVLIVLHNKETEVSPFQSILMIFCCAVVNLHRRSPRGVIVCNIHPRTNNYMTKATISKGNKSQLFQNVYVLVKLCLNYSPANFPSYQAKDIFSLQKIHHVCNSLAQSRQEVL